jgi:PAS domain S-box-containing protein
MTTQNDGGNDLAGQGVDLTTLRQRAEEEARATGDQDLEALSPEELRRLVHELQVHQIELERQNEELRRKQEELELIMDITPVYIGYLDSDLQILHVSRPQANWWGYSKTQAVGKNYKEVARPDAYERIAPYLRQAVTSGQTVIHEVQAASATGRAAVARVTSVPHLDEQGNVRGLVVLSLDISEQKRVEKELRIQQERLDLILDSLPAYVAFLDSDLNVLHANRHQAEWWGYSREQVVGMNYEEVAPPGSYEQIAPYLRQAMASRQTVTHEFQTVSATGQVAVGQVNSVPHLDEQGNVLGLFALSLDVTKERQAEEALRMSEERYRLLVENMREGMVVVDEDSLLTYVNDSLCAMTGWARDELLGRSSVEIFPASDRAQHRGWLVRRRAGFSDTYQTDFQRLDGRVVPLLVSASPILDSQGDYRGSLAVCTDITERVEMEQALRQRVEELTVLNRIAHTMAASADLPRALTWASEIIADLFAAHCVHIIWRESEEAGFELHVQCDHGAEEASPTPVDVSLDELAVLGRVLQEGRSQVVTDVQSLPLSDLDRELLVHREAQSILFIPLVIGGTSVGLMWIASDQPGRLSTEHEMSLAETIGLDLAAAIESANLSRQARAAAAAKERSRLARDLHDAATQTIYAATLIAEALPETWARNPAEGQRNLIKLRQLVRGALAEMRTLLFELRPWTLDAVELSKLLEYLANAQTGRTRAPVEWDIRGEHELSADATVALYRIAQEAFNNIVKHARPTRVRVTLRREADHGTLSIQDDGRGFDPASVGGDKMGLQIMRERAQAIGAKLTVESAPGLGTTVAVAWLAGGSSNE